MSGHNKWSQIQHRKSATDKKRSAIFSKLLNAISVAARNEQNPDFNPRLRSLVEKAKENNVPQENIQRVIKKTDEADQLEELIIEAYGPGSVALIIECITDNRNRTISEIKHLLNENGAKFAEQGSVRWAFDGDRPRFPQKISAEDQEKVSRLIQKLEERDDVQKIFTNRKNL